MASRIKSRESLENWGWQKLTSTAGRAFTIAASSYFHYSPFFELFSINIYPCSSRNFKGKEAPPPLEMLPDLSSLASLDGWPEIVPLFIAKPSNESPRTALSLLPMARVRLEFKRTVSDFKQVVIDPRCILYILKYRAKCEQTLASTLENRDISYISANLFHDPRVFDFTSSFPFRNEGSQQSKETGAGWSIDSRTRFIHIYTRITWGMLFAILEIHSVRAGNHRTISIRNNKMNTRKRLCRSMNFFLTSYRIDLSINSSSAHHSFVPRINAARSISTDKPLYIVPYPWSVTVFISSPSQTLNPPLEPR